MKIIQEGGHAMGATSDAEDGPGHQLPTGRQTFADYQVQLPLDLLS